MKPDSTIYSQFRLVDIQKKALKKLKIETIEDLLYHFPSKYGDTGKIRKISSAIKGDDLVFFGRISKLKTSKAFIKKIPMSEGILEDETGQIKCVWFSQPYIAKMFHDGQFVRVEGKISLRKGELYLSNPKIESSDIKPINVGNSIFGNQGEDHSMYPIYPESRGISSNWIYHAIQKIISENVLDFITDPIPQEILSKYNLPDIKTALIWIHSPKKESLALSARKRFAFQEVFFIQISKQIDRKLWNSKKTFVINTDKKNISEFVQRFPFSPTKSQLSAINEITKDLISGKPMSRLLEGDVGSGKTAVAATAVYAVTKCRPENKDYGNLQTAYMCPTEILAKQHYENFILYFKHLPLKIGLITGSECRIFPSKTNPAGWTKISKKQLSKWVENGEIPIIIGTHALIQKNIKFKHLAFAIIDEQHRFGTAQRQSLTTKNELVPHLLSMTATPIPRTLSLTIYGDLDLTMLDEMPSGRKPIITKIVMPGERNTIYNNIKKEISNGRQLYVICPRIDEPDPAKETALNAKSVKLESERLKKEVFPDLKIDILHSKMTPAEKENVMKKFEQGETNILVATSVVEVGVNVPNATMIIIEGAERFGLSQLHQLRGRVIRSNHQAYCFVFTESQGDKTSERLKSLVTAKNGFELAEFDLAQRGAGELWGTKQWGISDLAMEAIKNLKMVEFAREEAKKIVITDSNLSKYPLIKKVVSEKRNKIHFE